MGKAKVFLFETAVEEQNRKMNLIDEDNDTPFPIGLLYLDAVLKKNNYDVLTKDYTFWTEENCLKGLQTDLEHFRPDFVGIAVMSMTRVSTYKAINLVKRFNPNIKIVLGGIHPSNMYQQLLKHFDIDAVCIGEAEDSLVELFGSWLEKKPLHEIKGIGFKENSRVIITPPRPLRRDLENFPLPSYDVYLNPKIKRVQMVTSRGCPNLCSFCCLHVVGQQVWRPRGYMGVVDEIEHIAKNYPWVEEIQFVDDTMPLDNKRMINICQEIVKRGIKLKLYCQGRIKPVSRDMFYWMEQAGFVEIAFGIETGGDKMLKAIHKNITGEDCIATFHILKEFKKLKPVKFLIVGFPGETEETVEETITLVNKLGKIIKMDFFYATPLWVYPGSEIYEYCKKQGYMTDDFWLSENPCPRFTWEHSEEWLIKMSNRISMRTMLAQGKIFFMKRALEKVAKNPRYYLRRLFLRERF